MSDKKFAIPMHGGTTIDTRSNKQPKGVIGYCAQRCGAGGRVWRLHTGRRKSWLTDTVQYRTARRLARDLNADLREKKA